MHELAVITIVIADYGREEKHADLADRFLQHAWIARYRDAEVYQQSREALGQEPISDEDMTRMQQQHDLLIEQYGRAYGKQYGWAIGLNGQTSPPDFKELERLADMCVGTTSSKVMRCTRMPQAGNPMFSNVMATLI